MFALFISLASLGLAAIDPVGIGVMPILLIQKRPYLRSFIFLSGSFIAILITGLLVAKGLGRVVLRFDSTYKWLIPLSEAITACILFVIAAHVYTHSKAGKATINPSGRMRKWLKLGNWHLFIGGALLVILQSLLDVVFIIAMVRVGQFRLSDSELIAAVGTYAAAALALQFLVIVAFRATPSSHRERTLHKVNDLLVTYSNQVVITVSLGLGCLLLALAI